MSPRKFINFLRSKTGLLLLFMLALCAVLIIANSRKGAGQGENQIGSKSKTASPDRTPPTSPAHHAPDDPVPAAGSRG
jgi:hypothetical protein